MNLFEKKTATIWFHLDCQATYKMNLQNQQCSIELCFVARSREMCQARRTISTTYTHDAELKSPIHLQIQYQNATNKKRSFQNLLRFISNALFINLYPLQIFWMQKNSRILNKTLGAFKRQKERMEMHKTIKSFTIEWMLHTIFWNSNSAKQLNAMIFSLLSQNVEQNKCISFWCLKMNSVRLDKDQMIVGFPSGLSIFSKLITIGVKSCVNQFTRDFYAKNLYDV